MIMKSLIKSALEDKELSVLFKKGGISFILRIIGQILGFLLTLIIAQYFGAEGLGEYMLAIVILRIFSLLAKLGMDTTSIRITASLAAQEKWLSLRLFFKKVYLILIFTSLFFACLMYLLSDDISILIDINSEYIRIFSYAVIPMVFFALHHQSLRGLKQIGAFSFYYRVSQPLLSIIVLLILLNFSKDIVIPFYTYIISIFLVCFFSFFSFRNIFNKRNNHYNEKSIEDYSIKKIFLIAAPLMLAQSVQLIMVWTDKLMIGNMLSASNVGIYGVAFKLSMFASITLMAINSIAAPRFAELYSENRIKDLKNIVQKSTMMIFWSTLPLCIVFFLFPNIFLGFFGEEFKTGVTAFIILSCGMLVSAFSGSVGNLLQMSGQQFVFMKILVIGAIINVGLNYMLIPEENILASIGISGINGAAVSTMTSIVFWNIAMVMVVRKQFGFLTFYIPFRIK